VTETDTTTPDTEGILDTYFDMWRTTDPDHRATLVAQAFTEDGRHVEVLGEVEHELPARLRPTRLHEAEVAGRHRGLVGEVELAEPPPLAPVAEQVAHARRRGDRCHAADRTDTVDGQRLPDR